MLYVSDLDGTLLNKQGSLSSYSRALLSDLLQNGLSFTVASARSVWSISQMLRGLELTLPVIEFNGAFLTDLKTCKHLRVNAVKEAVKHGVYLEMQAVGFLPCISTFDGERDNLYFPHIRNEGMRWYFDDRTALQDPRVRPPRDIENILDEQVICFTVIDREPGLKALASRLESIYGGMLCVHLFRHLYTEGWHWLTVHDARACKSRSLKDLLEMLNIPKEEVTVFGDDVNDVDLFDAAGRAVAVSNALEEVKQNAHVVIGSNEEDSVARFIEKDFGRRKPD